MKNITRNIAALFVLSGFVTVFADEASKNPEEYFHDKVAGQQLPVAEAAMLNKDYKKALELYQSLADNGNQVAQYQLGYLYLNALDAKDPQRASTWFSKASDQNYAPAKLALGVLYYYGVGVPRDLSHAIDLFNAATQAPGGNGFAEFMLGTMTASGYGVTASPVLATARFTKAAQLGIAQAQYNLGLTAYNQDPDLSKAFAWFSTAAQQGLAKAQFMLGLMYSTGKAIPIDKTQALNWYSKAAAQSLPEAQYNLGVLYFTGQGTPVNVTAGYDLFVKAAQTGMPRAQYVMGYLINSGATGEKNPQKAAEWYTKAAQQNLADAQFSLGYMYDNGQGFTKDDKQALYWYSLAAKQGLMNAQYMVGLFYQQGRGIPNNPSLAAYWYTKAAEQGMDNAQLLLGVMYFQGQGITRDNKLAYAWLDLASTSSNEQIRDAALKLRDVLAKLLSPSDMASAKQLSMTYYNKYANAK